MITHSPDLILSISSNSNIHASLVNSLDTSNSAGANIELDNCRGGNPEGNIAQAFADHFGSDVTAYESASFGSSFGYPIPRTSIRFFQYHVRAFPFELPPDFLSAKVVYFEPKVRRTHPTVPEDHPSTNPMDADGTYPAP